MAFVGSRGRDLLRPSHLVIDKGFASSSSTLSDDDDDYIVQLACQMAYNMLQEDDKYTVDPTICSQNPKLWGVPDSPQSTLCGFGNCGSPKELSPEHSPPATHVNRKGDRTGLIYEAARKFEKMNLNDKGSTYLENTNGGFQSRHVLRDDRIRSIKFDQLKQEQLMKEQGNVYLGRRRNLTQQIEPNQRFQNLQNGGKACSGCTNGRRVRALGLSSPTSAWPPLQQRQQKQQGGWGMRAIFLGGSASRGGSCGTGVFLPRGIGNLAESRKKPGCSTALLPARVVQALKLDLDETGVLHRSDVSDFPREHDAVMGGGSSRGTLLSQQTRHSRPLPAISHHNEMGLPQEWTY